MLNVGCSAAIGHPATISIDLARSSLPPASRLFPHFRTFFLTFPLRESRIKLLPEIHLRALSRGSATGARAERMSATSYLPAQSRCTLRAPD